MYDRKGKRDITHGTCYSPSKSTSDNLILILWDVFLCTNAMNHLLRWWCGRIQMHKRNNSNHFKEISFLGHYGIDTPKKYHLIWTTTRMVQIMIDCTEEMLQTIQILISQSLYCGIVWTPCILNFRWKNVSCVVSINSNNKTYIRPIQTSTCEEEGRRGMIGVPSSMASACSNLMSLCLGQSWLTLADVVDARLLI